MLQHLLEMMRMVKYNYNRFSCINRCFDYCFAAIGTGMFSGSNEEISSDASSSSSSVSGDSGVQSLSLSSFPVSEAPGLAQAIKK